MSAPDATTAFTTSRPRVLLLRPSALGDVARSVPALVTVRRALPGAHIDWLVQDNFADVIRHHPALNGVIEFPRRGFNGFWYNPRTLAAALAWSNQLRFRGYDLAIDLQGLFRSGLFTWLTRAPRRVGLANARELGWLGYNRRHAVPPHWHTVDRMLGLLAAEGFTPVCDLTLHVGPQDQAWLCEQGLASSAYAVLAPTARWQCKCWPIDNYIQIARRLLQAGGVDRLVVLASPAERPQVQPLVDALEPAFPGAVTLPRTSVGQMMAILSRARILVCNDSAPLHIAVGLNRPAVAIFGPTDPALVGPYGRPDSVVQPAVTADELRTSYRRHDDQSLISRVSVDQVWARVQEQFGG